MGDVVVFDRTPDTDESLVAALLRNLAESVGLRTPEADLIKRVIALPGEMHAQTLQLLQICQQYGVGARVVPDLLQYASARAALEDFDGEILAERYADVGSSVSGWEAG